MIGNEIKKIVRKRGLTNIAFAEMMNMEERNLYHFYKKEQIDIDQLLKASQVLDFDFISLYIKNSEFGKNYQADSPIKLAKESQEKYIRQTDDPKISFTVNILGSFDKITKELPDILKVLKDETESRGLHLG